jgi:arylsulfatase A-like enzyme
LRGHKATTYEGGIRVPAFAWWPGRLKPRKLETPVFAVDWLPTFATLAGAAPPAAQKLDGTDLMPLLTDAAPAPQRILYLKYLDGMSALRDGDWKLVTRGTGNFSRANMRGPDRGDQLFNIAQDPRERHDLAKTNPDVLARMQALLIEQMRGDSPTFRDGNLQYWWSRVPEQKQLIEQRTAEEKKKRSGQKSKPSQE